MGKTSLVSGGREGGLVKTSWEILAGRVMMIGEGGGLDIMGL